MRTYKVYAFIRYKVKISCIPFFDIHFTLCRLIFKACLFSAPFKSNVIYIYTDYITIQKFCFYKGSASTCKLVEN